MGDLGSDSTLEAKSGQLKGHIPPNWGQGRVNGGFLATLALRAAATATDHARPLGIHIHYLERAQPGEITLEVEVLRSSVVSDALAVSGYQKKRVFTALVRTTSLRSGPHHLDCRAPIVPPPVALVNWEELQPDVAETVHEIVQNFEIRRVTFPHEWPPSERPAAHGLAWLRFSPTPRFDDPFIDAGRQLVAIDALVAPVIWLTHYDVDNLNTISLDLSVNFTTLTPKDDWMLCDIGAPVANGGVISGTGRIFDLGGALVATGLTNMAALSTR